MMKLIAAPLSVCAVVLTLFAGGCSKESLVVIALTASPADADLSSVDVEARGTTKNFKLTGGLTASPTSIGFYLPSSVTGLVVFTARATGGGACYSGTKSVTIGSAGATVPDVKLALTPSDTCVAGDGAAGSGAAGAGAGTAGTGAAATDGGAGTGAAGTSGPATDGGAGTGGPRPDGAAGTGAAGTTGGAGTTGAAGTGAAGTAPPQLAWHASVNIEKDPTTPSYWPAIAIDKTHGNVLVAWTKGDYAAVSRYDAAKKTWGPPKILDDRGSAQNLTVAMNDAGQAVVVWTQYEGTPTPALRGIYGVHSEDGGVTWSAIARIHDQSAWSTVALAMDAAGNARVVWEELTRELIDGFTENVYTVWSAPYSGATHAWSAAAAVKKGVNGWDHYAHLAIAPTGAGILVWNQADALGDDSVWASTFTTPTGALSTPVEVDAFSGNDTYIPTVAISPDGTRGLVVWEQDTASAGELWGNDWTPTTGFAGPQKIVASPSGLGEPSVVIDKSYTATLAWTQSFTGGRWNVVAARRPVGQPWGTPTPLETTNFSPGQTDVYPYPQIGADLAGNVHVLWRRKVMAPETENTFSVIVRTFSANAWQPEFVLGLKPGLEAYIVPALAVGDDGHAAATFVYYDPGQTHDVDAFNLFVGLFN